jgi:small subunit ribosomal protein S13
MVRISGVNIQDNKQVAYSLTSIFGIGISTSKIILKSCKIDERKKVSELSDADVEKIRGILGSDYRLEGDLKMQISQNIKRLKEINSYRGMRHIKGLPVRGQRTKTNARTKRGRKMTVGSGKKAPTQKT